MTVTVMAIAEHNRETLVSEDKQVHEGDVRQDGCVKHHVRSEWEDAWGRPLWVVTEVGPNGRCRDTFVNGYELSDMTLVERDWNDPRN